MEGFCIRTSPRITVSVSKSKSFVSGRNLTSKMWTPKISMDSERKSPILGCTEAEQESVDKFSEVAHNSNYVANSTETRELECGKSLNEIFENQGIRIRRHPSTGPPMHTVGPFEFRLENEGNTPRNILEKIIWDKDKEVSKLKERKPLAVLSKVLSNAPPARDFAGALRVSYERTSMPALIAEVKKASPSRGVLREDFDPIQIAKAYERNGAACLSVLTDEKYFQGSFENLEAIRMAGVKCPLLCKEFIIDAWQIYYARSKGADAILLIAAVLPDLDIKYMTKICSKLGLAALVEVHNEKEMDRVLSIDGIQLIGINNRNLETFEVNISNTKMLLEGKRGEIIRQRDIIIVGESGLFTPEDISYVQDAGVKAVLVGESLIKQDDPGKGIARLFGGGLRRKLRQRHGGRDPFIQGTRGVTYLLISYGPYHHGQPPLMPRGDRPCLLHGWDHQHSERRTLHCSEIKGFSRWWWAVTMISIASSIPGSSSRQRLLSSC